MFKLKTLTGLMAMVAVAGVAQANYLDGQGREWLDMTVVNGNSWHAINAVCQSNTEAAGPCSGLLGGIGGYDLTGWTWANRDEVVALIDSFLVASGDASNVTDLVSQNGYGTNSFGWGPALIAAMGQTELQGTSDRRTVGYMNGIDNVGSVDYGHLAFVCTGCGFTSYAGAGVSAGVVPQSLSSGWFYRTATTTTPVPEPTSLALVGLALLGLTAVRRRLS